MPSNANLNLKILPVSHGLGTVRVWLEPQTGPSHRQPESRSVAGAAGQSQSAEMTESRPGPPAGVTASLRPRRPPSLAGCGRADGVSLIISADRRDRVAFSVTVTGREAPPPGPGPRLLHVSCPKPYPSHDSHWPPPRRGAGY